MVKCDKYFSYHGKKKLKTLKSMQKSGFISVFFFISYTEYFGNSILAELSMISLLKSQISVQSVLQIITNEAFVCSYLKQSLTN